MATAHLIHGYLGAGKTTLAKQLATELPALRFSHDEWMSRLFGEDPPATDFEVNHGRVWDLMASIWGPALALGVDVILDFGFWRRSERDAVRAQVLATDGEVRLYSLACSDDEAWRRIKRRNLALDGSLLITRNTFEVLRARFEPLEADEARIDSPSQV